MISRYGLVETRVLLIPVGNGACVWCGAVEAMLWFSDQAKLPRTFLRIVWRPEQTENK